MQASFQLPVEGQLTEAIHSSARKTFVYVMEGVPRWSFASLVDVLQCTEAVHKPQVFLPLDLTHCISPVYSSLAILSKGCFLGGLPATAPAGKSKDSIGAIQLSNPKAEAFLQETFEDSLEGSGSMGNPRKKLTFE